MGFALYLKINRDKAASVEAARDELYEWIEGRGGYERMYLPWRLANHMTVIFSEDDGPKEYFGPFWPNEDEALVFHHDIPWLWRLSPEVMAKARECFERHGVIDVWWNIVKENGEGTDLIDQLLPDLEKNKHEARG